MGELFKPGLPLGRDLARLVDKRRSLQPLTSPRFVLVCLRCGARFYSLEEAFLHQSVCRGACFRIERV